MTQETRTANARFDGIEDGVEHDIDWWWEKLDADGNGIEEYFVVEAKDDRTGEGHACGVCDRGFTQSEWRDRHDDDDDPDLYYHAGCRPICKAVTATSATIYGEANV